VLRAQLALRAIVAATGLRPDLRQAAATHGAQGSRLAVASLPIEKNTGYRRAFGSSASVCYTSRMKVNPIVTPTNQTINQVTITTQANGNTTAQARQTNFNSTSQAFQQMNARIVYLDTVFEGLPALTKAAWDSQATMDYSTIPICGCEGNIVSGKKLFRLINYFRALIGLADISVPPVVWTPILSGFTAQGVFYDSGFPLLVNIRSIWSSSDQNCVYNCNLGLLNPIIHGFVTNFLAGSPTYEALRSMLAKGYTLVCIFGPDGQPGGTCECPLSVI
jgi:hypothetical protein